MCCCWPDDASCSALSGVIRMKNVLYIDSESDFWTNGPIFSSSFGVFPFKSCNMG